MTRTPLVAATMLASAMALLAQTPVPAGGSMPVRPHTGPPLVRSFESAMIGEHILVHEFSHNVMGALRTADPELYARIQHDVGVGSGIQSPRTPT